MKFFSDGFYKWLGVIASLFVITLSSLQLHNMSLINRALIAILFDSIFIICIFVFVILQFKDREDEFKGAYLNIHNYASNLELEYNKLLESSGKLDESLQQLVDAYQALQNDNSNLQNQTSALSEQLAMANKILEIYKNRQPTNFSLNNPHQNPFLDGLKGILPKGNNE